MDSIRPSFALRASEDTHHERDYKFYDIELDFSYPFMVSVFVKR
jgi:hypothetical protein